MNKSISLAHTRDQENNTPLSLKLREKDQRIYARILFSVISPLQLRSLGLKPQIVLVTWGLLDVSMALTILCQGCGKILYEGEEMKPPYELLSELNGRCPLCERRLSHIPQSFEVRPIEENELVT